MIAVRASLLPEDGCGKRSWDAKMKLRRLLTVLTIGALSGGMVPAVGQVRSLAMLDNLNRGMWELRERGGPATAVTRLCLTSGRQLIQLRHPEMPCASIVVEDGPTAVTVQYTCPGQGYGRTQIRRETDSLLQVDTQGVAKGAPFSYVVEARRLGSC